MMQEAAAPFHTALFFSGLDNVRRVVLLEPGEALNICEHGTVIAVWPWHDIRRIGTGSGGKLRLSCASAPELARLEIAEAGTATLLHSLCPRLEAGDPGNSRLGGIARIVFWSLAAAASIIALVVYGVPLAADRLAPYVPKAVENRIGQMVDGQVKALFGNRLCHSAAGDAALLKLVGTIYREGGLEGEVDAAVLRTKIPNAIALPGGKVYVFQPLLDDAESADELGGVIAHELGHVHNRDGMRRIIQTGGTSFLIGLLFGDVTGSGAAVFIGRELLDSAYSREAETRADAFAIDVMKKLGRSPKPLGQLLTRMTEGKEFEAMAILASHPLTKDRLAAMENAGAPAPGPPLLTDGEWKALKSICTG